MLKIQFLSMKFEHVTIAVMQLKRLWTLILTPLHKLLYNFETNALEISYYTYTIHICSLYHFNIFKINENFNFA